MIWILLAILAHVGNGFVFIVDKSLLRTKTAIGKPIAYALYSAAFAGLSILLIPWAHISITTFLLFWACMAGAVHIAALYMFFTAMRAGEPSRVVPITGSAVPLFTILFALTFLGEQFTTKEGIGMALLLIGGMILSVIGTVKKSHKKQGAWILPIIAGVLFAAYFAITKYIYAHDADQFLGIFIITRVVEAAIALGGIALMTKGFITLFARKKKSATHKRSRIGATSIVFVCNKTLAAGSFLLQTYAISLGSVSVVNALQGVQYVFVLILAVLVSLFLPKIFSEEIGKGTLLQKIAGIVLVSFGVALLV